MKINKDRKPRTPEQEAYRLRRLREVMARPRSELWKQHLSAGVRKAFAEGRIKALSAESREKGAAKLRGRKRPAEVVEKIRAANLGKKRSLSVRQAMSERVKAGYTQGKYRASAEGSARRVIAARSANRGRKHTEEQNRAHGEKLRGRLQPRELVEKRATPMRGRAQTALLTRKGPTNKNGLIGAIRSPENVIYTFRNLTHFVREHPHLFHPEDVLWRYTNGSQNCRASKGLINLFGRGKVVNGSWKGWTIVSHTELEYNCGDDLLQRPWDISS